MSTSTASFSKSPNHTGTRISPNLTNIGIIPSTGPACLVAVGRLGNLVGLIWYTIVGAGTIYSPDFALHPIPVCMTVFAEHFLGRVPNDIPIGYVGWRKNETTFYSSPWNAMATAYVIFDSKYQVHVAQLSEVYCRYYRQCVCVWVLGCLWWWQ